MGTEIHFRCGTQLATPDRFACCPAHRILVIIIRLWPRLSSAFWLRLACGLALPHDISLRIFAPGKNRRLNELIGFLLCVSALLLFLALASYSPLDPSLNSASVLTGSHAARNWIGILGAYLSDVVLQFLGVGAFLFPVFLFVLGARWFRSRTVQAPIAETLGAIWLLMFVPALLAILPGTPALDGRNSN